MIIRLFKGQQPLVFIVLPVFILVVWLFSGFQYFSIASDNGMPLYSLFFKFVNGWPSLLLAFLCFVIIGMQCLHFNWILNKYEVLNKPTYLPALFYFLFTAFLPQFVIFHPILFVNTLMLFVLERIFRLYKNTLPLSLDFDICMLISLASLFYLPALLFCILFFLSLTILKPFSWRDWVVGLMGLLIPYFFTFVFFILTDNLGSLTDMLARSPLPDHVAINNLLPDGYRLTIVVMGVFFVAGLLRLRNNFYKNDIRTRNFHQVIVVFIFTSIVCALLTKENMLYKLSIIVIPLSIIITNYFLYLKKNWWAELLFLTLLTTLVFNYVISY